MCESKLIQTTVASSQRETWVDWYKAILIFLMIVGHAELASDSIQWTLIYAFHMPAFFFISGYLYKPHNWARTLRSFIVPIMFYSFICFLFFLLLSFAKHELDIKNTLLLSLRPFWTQAHCGDITLFTGIWFLEVLLVFRFIMGDVKKITFINKHGAIISLFLIGFMIIENKINIPAEIRETNIYKSLSCFPFFAVGSLLKNNSKIKNLFLTEGHYATKLIFSISCLIVYITGTQHIGFVSIWSNDYGGNVPLFYANAFSATFLLCIICTYLKRFQIVELYSVGTLLILGCHYMIIILARQPIHILNIETPFLPWILGTAIMLLCYFPIKLALKYCPILLGK